MNHLSGDIAYHEPIDLHAHNSDVELLETVSPQEQAYWAEPVARHIGQLAGGEVYRWNRGPYFPVPHPVDKERTTELHSSLWRRAEELSIEDHLVLAEDRQKPPKAIGDYKFVPVLPKAPDFLEYNLGSVGSDLETSAGVTFEYQEPGGTPFMDGRIGLGLAFRGRLVALCSGGITRDGPMILQLQDVSNKQPPDTTDPKVLRSFPYSNGLYSGIDWKSTLVHGWCSLVSQTLPAILPETLGMRVWVQSAQNNTWVNRAQYTSDGSLTGQYNVDQGRLKRLTTTYDKTAYKLGGAPDPQSRNMILPRAFAVGWKM